MNLTKLLDEILSTLSTYAPIFVVHVLLVVWLSAWVLQPGVLPGGESVWTWITGLIDTALNAIGLSVERWYVLAAVVIGYLTVFQWVSSIILDLPILRIRYPTRYDAHLLGYAGQVLRKRPDMWKVGEALSKLVEQYTKQLSEAGQAHPYQWLFDRHQTWFRYYGSLLVALFGTIAWALEGGTLARSVGHVWETVVLLVLICLMIRWNIFRNSSYQESQLGYWALREFERRQTEPRPDPLEWKRYDLIVKECQFQEAFRKHPAALADLLLRRLPDSVAETLGPKLRFPLWQPSADWDILASQESKFEHEEHVPPKALRVDGFLERFVGLLECTGAGLCILAPRSLGLAPSVQGGGASYCFAERRHGGFLLPIDLLSKDGLSGSQIGVRNYSEEKAFIAEVGDYPIELVAQVDLPYEGKEWYKIIKPRLDKDIWPPLTQPNEKVVGNITLSDRVHLNLGSSYVAGFETRHGTQAIVGFQCFQVERSEKLLIAWRILQTFAPEEEVPEILPWWRPRAWTELWRVQPRDD